jgi:hypothetical protein
MHPFEKAGLLRWSYIFLIMVLLAGCGGPETPETRRATMCKQDAHGRIEAFSMVVQIVTQRLKAPATASFPSWNSEDVSSLWTGECNFSVVGYVDSQNSFGAKLRTNFVAQLTYVPDVDKWRLVKLDIK